MLCCKRKPKRKPRLPFVDLTCSQGHRWCGPNKPAGMCNYCSAVFAAGPGPNSDLNMKLDNYPESWIHPRHTEEEKRLLRATHNENLASLEGPFREVLRVRQAAGLGLAAQAAYNDQRGGLYGPTPGPPGIPPGFFDLLRGDPHPAMWP